MSALQMLIKMSGTESDKEKKKAILNSAAVGAVSDVTSNVTGLNPILGLIYGAEHGHPVAGFFGGPTAVEGANVKDRNGKHGTESALAVIGGSAAAGGVLGYARSDKVKENRLKKLDIAKDLFDLSEQRYQNSKELLNNMSKGRIATSEAGSAALLGALGYGMGRLMGKKKRKKK